MYIINRTRELLTLVRNCKVHKKVLVGVSKYFDYCQIANIVVV